MKYKTEDKDKIIKFLKQAIKLVEGGDICEYKDVTNNYHMLFEVTPINKFGNGI